jgi:type VI secretion system secreted protein Hcp
MPIYCQIDGIQGDATHQNHQKWMDIQSLHWNVSRHMNTIAGSAANREASEPNISEVTLMKTSDSSSVKLFQEACTGRVGKKAVIHLVTTGNPGDTIIEYQLTNTLISGYTVGSDGDRPVETITLNFTKLDVKYTPYDDKHQAQSPMIGSYDIGTTKAA